ncbi:MAG: alpha/beta fold hydrolase [Oscillospiraceae bacterium]|nr:alpha/beta fold hydrolase [Oscillospiraceae bacterium]
MMKKMKNKKKSRSWQFAGIFLAVLILTATGCNAQNPDSGADSADPEMTESLENPENSGNLENSDQDQDSENETATSDTFQALTIVGQGVFSSGGVVTSAVSGDYDPAQSWKDETKAGNTAHIDHANVFYQIPAENNDNPIVYLHGYRQSRVCWMTTPDGREGFSTLFMRNGHSAFLVDQPRRGAAGAASEISGDTDLDMWYGEIDTEDEDFEKPETATKYQPGDQAWYTYYRIGENLGETNKNSQFPDDEASLDQFLRQATPNTGDYDKVVMAKALGEVMNDVKTMTGNKAIFMGHAQGCSVAWDLSTDNLSAIVAIEPIVVPKAGSSQYQKLLDAKIPIVIYYGDYITNGDTELASTMYWQEILANAEAFAEQYTADGGDCTVIELPSKRINGNSHFMFQEENNKEIADLIEKWLGDHKLN